MTECKNSTCYYNFNDTCNNPHLKMDQNGACQSSKYLNTFTVVKHETECSSTFTTENGKLNFKIK